MKIEKEVVVCFKCKTAFECNKSNRCPHCGSINIHKTNTKPLNLDPNKDK